MRRRHRIESAWDSLRELVLRPAVWFPNLVAVLVLFACATASGQTEFRPRPRPEPAPAPQVETEKSRPILEGIGKAIGRVGQFGGKVLDAGEHAIGLPARIENAVVWMLVLATGVVVAVYIALGLAAWRLLTDRRPPAA
jgi:hypothetical protein